MDEDRDPRDAMDGAAYLYILFASAVGAILYAQHNVIEEAFGKYTFIYYLCLWLCLVLALSFFYHICKLGGKSQ